MTQILVTDSWTGSAAEQRAVFTAVLERTATGAFFVTSRLALLREEAPRVFVRECKLTAADARRFLSKLTRVELRSWDGAPIEFRTINGPNYRIVLHAVDPATGLLEVAVAYLCADKGCVMPWRVLVNDQTMMVAGDELELAARGLERDLGRRELEREVAATPRMR